MPPAARATDMTMGHGCFNPSTLLPGSPTVLINNLPAARATDPMVPHVCGPTPCPLPPQIAKGSSSVLVNNLPLSRVADSMLCGDMIATGSGNVIVGG